MRKSNNTYEKINRLLKTIKYNKDKIVILEQKIDQIKDEEDKFQARIAILNYHQSK
jgi:hypothetical protein